MFDKFISKDVHILRTRLILSASVTYLKLKRFNHRIDESNQSPLVLSLPAHFGRGVDFYLTLCAGSSFQTHGA